MVNAIIITNAEDIPAALSVINSLDDYKFFVFDPTLVDKLAERQLVNIEFVPDDSGVDYPAITKWAHAAAFGIEKDLADSVKDIVPEVSIYSWQHLNIYYLLMAYNWYARLWPGIISKLLDCKVHVFVCDNPATYYNPSFIPTLLLMQYMKSNNIDFNAYTYGSKESDADLVPDFFAEGAESVRCDILTHLPTCFYDYKYFNDELGATGQSVINMRARDWNAPINAVRTVETGRLADLLPRLPETFSEKQDAFSSRITEKLNELLDQYIRSSGYCSRQAQHLASLYVSQLATYYSLEEYFKKNKPSKILLSDHDAGFHGPVVSFAENNNLPIVLLPHSRTTGDIEFNGRNFVSLVHPIQGESFADRNGKRILTHKLAFPEVFEASTHFPKPVRKFGMLLNGLSLNGVMCTRFSSYIAGIKTIVKWCADNEIELSIRCRPHLPMMVLLAEAAGIEISALKRAVSVSLTEYAKNNDLCLMYDTPTAAALEFLQHSVPILNPIPEDISWYEAATIDSKIVPRGSVGTIINTLDSFVADPTNFFVFRNNQFRDYVNAFSGSYPLRHFL